jgi:uncharacterized membrane protein HdeD (DUF308 family)
MADDSLITQEVDRVFRRIGITGEAAALLMILFGILILVFRDLVPVLIGLYLVIVGVLQLLGHIDAGRRRTGATTPLTGSPPYSGPPMP